MYCDKVVRLLDTGGPGVDPALIQAKHQCESDELQSFMLIEAIADMGGVDKNHRCVTIAAHAGGSYKALLDCLKTERAAAARSENPQAAPSIDNAEPGGGRVCCRYCERGKPCGDSCISTNKSCRKPPGCAC